MTAPRGLDCAHVWVPNGGRGGEPSFRRISMLGEVPVMSVACSKCTTRTWFTRSQWLSLPREGETRGERRRRQREAKKAAAQERAVLKRRLQERQAAYDRDGGTYWNGKPCEARRVRVIVGESERSTWWCADLEGEEREAVEVKYGGQTFYLDNEDGLGWAKVTLGRGSPGWGHASLPVDEVIGPGETQ